MSRAASLAALAVTALGAGTIGVGSAQAAAASSCRASALELSLLGSASTSVISAGGAPCATDRGAVDLDALGSAQATAVEAVTDRSSVRTPGSAARIAGLNLGIDGITKQLTAPLLSGPGSVVSQITSQLGAATAPSGQLGGALAPLNGLGLQVSGIDTAVLLNSATTQLPAALQASLPSIVTADVLTAGVRAQCVSGRSVLSTTTDLTGVKVLGSTIDPDDQVARAVTLDSTHLTLGQLVSTNDVLKSIKVSGTSGSLLGTLLGSGDRNLYTLLTSPGGLVGSLPLGTSAKQVLDGLSTALAPVLQTELNISPDLLRVVVTPQVETNDGATATATTLQLSATVSGKPVLSGALARASITANSADCTGSGKDPQKELNDVGLLGLTYASVPSQMQLQCDDAPVRLTDVRRSGTRTVVEGVAQKRFVGKTIDIMLLSGRKKVGKATVKADGSFSTKVALPPSKIRATNAARYYGMVSGAKSNKLKFNRRMEVTKITASGGNVTMTGQITLPRLAKQKAVVLQRRVTCTKYVKVGTVRPNTQGRFTATFKAPAGATYALFRAQTSVPKRAGSKRTFATYTLPRLTRLK